MWWFFVLVALVAAPAAHATPSVSSKQAQAQGVLAQIQGLDANLERAVDSYNLANEKLGEIQSDLRENKLELRLARRNLNHAQAMLSQPTRPDVHRRAARTPASRCCSARARSTT